MGEVKKIKSVNNAYELPLFINKKGEIIKKFLPIRRE